MEEVQVKRVKIIIIIIIIIIITIIAYRLKNWSSLDLTIVFWTSQRN